MNRRQFLDNEQVTVIYSMSSSGSFGMRIRHLVMTFALGCLGAAVAAPPAKVAAPPAKVTTSPADPQSHETGPKAPLVQLGPGDSVTIAVYGQPDLNGTVYVSDDGTIPVALTGPVKVGGLSPAEASARIEKALRDGKYLVDPHVTLTVSDSRSQRVSVLGQVGKPGRYAIQSDTSIFDLLAEAGGITEIGGDQVFILRTDKAGAITRYPISLKALAEGTNTDAVALTAGDSVMVPVAPQLYIYGEVTAPGKFKVEPGMTVVQAIARAGGVTQRGSANRVDIKRRKPDGSYQTTKASLSDLVQADDVIRVKESIF
jgi:polysaccharide biosynthesis/export protein